MNLLFLPETLRETFAPILISLFLKAPECSTLNKPIKPSLWANAHQVESSLYCKSISLGLHAIRQRFWLKALDFAKKSNQEQPKQAGSWVLQGLALSYLPARSNEAIAAFETAYSLNSMVLDDVDVLDRYGLALLQNKNFERASSIYQRLLPRLPWLSFTKNCSDLCPSLGLPYATMASLYLRLGPQSLYDASVILRHGYKMSQPKESKEVLAALLALTFSRMGEHEEARRLSQDLCTKDCFTSSAVNERWAEPNELVALRAFALESHNPTESKKLWQEYVRNIGPKHHWTQHAEARIRTLDTWPKK